MCSTWSHKKDSSDLVAHVFVVMNMGKMLIVFLSASTRTTVDFYSNRHYGDQPVNRLHYATDPPIDHVSRFFFLNSSRESNRQLGLMTHTKFSSEFPPKTSILQSLWGARRQSDRSLTLDSSVADSPSRRAGYRQCVGISRSPRHRAARAAVFPAPGRCRRASAELGQRGTFFIRGGFFL